ncbi:MAG: glycosyltransferase family 2 protein [Gemmatimonadaceae bacterium]|nr:glycosyltransferase family 2 protein [Gemmatimonadaceae bacterium]
MELPDSLALVAAAPWAVAPTVVAWRLLDSSPLPPARPWHEGAPRVSVIVPARNEAGNIERLVRSVLASTWGDLELIVVDDHSSDGTGTLARTAGFGDPRLRVISPPPLPEGWFGKQWACVAGAQIATGDRLLFADADTWHAPELIARLVRAQDETGATLLSIAGRQEMRTFWERVALPVPFFILALRFGGLNAIERATRPTQALANGQCLMFTREAYDALGGWEAVRDTVADDLRMAQHVVARGGKVVLRAALDAQSTRMYDSLGALVAGWAKNLYSGGKFVVAPSLWPLLRVVTAVGPWVLLAPLLAVLAGLSPSTPTWVVHAGVIALTVQTVWAAVMYRWLQLPMWHALCHPLGAVIFCWIGLIAAVRGDGVTWRGRTYPSQ